MKKLISITLVLTMILIMCACGANKDDTNSGAATSEEVTTEATGNDADNAVAQQSEKSTEEIEVNKHYTIRGLPGSPLILLQKQC